jgi:sugar phosphate isomerase/epimerase
MQIGLLTDSLSTMTRAEALETAADLGIETVEIGLGGSYGGWSPAPHADLTELLTDSEARTALRRDITSHGLRLEAFNASGNPLHPVEGARDDKILRNAIQLAEEFEVGTVVTMSGLPAAPGDTFPAWITTVWPEENLRLLNHQWTVAIDYWGELAAEAKRRGVRVAVEMHANQLVYNVPGLLRLREAVGDAIGANFDPSHVLWMGADPIAAIMALRGAIHRVHAKDTGGRGSSRSSSSIDLTNSRDGFPPGNRRERS